MKQLLWLAFSCLIVTITQSCSPAKTEPQVLKFDLSSKTKYNFNLIRITGQSQNSWSGVDSVYMDFSLQTILKDTLGDRILMKISRLYLNSSFSTDAKRTAAMQKSDLLMEGYRKDKAALYKQIHDDSLILIINNQGSLEMLDGYDALVSKLAAEKGIDERDVKMYLKDYLTSAALRDLLRELFFYLPAGQITKGNTWVNNTMFTAMAPVKYSNLVTVDSIGEFTVHLGVATQVTAGEQDNYYLKGQRTATVIAEAKTGVPIRLMSVENTTVNTAGGETKKIRTLIVTSYFP